MAKFSITAMYEYAGEVEADTEQEALSIFYDDLNSFYVSTESEEIEEVEDDEEENLEILLHDAELEDEDI